MIIFLRFFEDRIQGSLFLVSTFTVITQKSWAVKLPPGNTRNMDGTAMGP